MPRTLIDYLENPGGEQDELTEGLANVIQTADGAAKLALSLAFNTAIGALVKTIAGATHTLVDADHGYMILFTGACNITVPTGLRSDFSCGWTQAGASQLTFTPSSTTIREVDSHTKSGGQWSAGGLTAIGTNEYLLSGRTSV